MKLVKRILVGTAGAEIAETAVVLPLLFTVLLGIFFFGRAYNIYGTITQAPPHWLRSDRRSVPGLCMSHKTKPLTRRSDRNQCGGACPAGFAP